MIKIERKLSIDNFLHPLDLTTEGAEVFAFAPAEGNTPLNIFFEKKMNEFPNNILREKSSRE